MRKISQNHRPREKRDKKKEKKDSRGITSYNEPYGNSTSGYFSTPRVRALTYQINEAGGVIDKLQGEITKNERRLDEVKQQKVMYPPVQEQQEKLYRDRIAKLEDAIEAQQDKIAALEKELREEYAAWNQPYPGVNRIKGGSTPGNHRIAPANQNQPPINNGSTGNSGNTPQGSGAPGGSSSHLSPGGSKANFDAKRHQNNVNIGSPKPQFRIKRNR